MNNQDFTQTSQNAGTTASETLEALNKINAENGNPNRNALSVACGVLFLLAAVFQLIRSITSLVSFFQWIGSWYATFANIFPNILMFLGHLAAAAGFVIIGLSFFIKKGSFQQILKFSPLLVIGYCICSALTNLIYCIYWSSANFALWLLFNIIYGLFWAVIAMIFFEVKPEFTKKLNQAYIIVPAVLLGVEILAEISYYSFTNILTLVVEFAAMIILGIIIYLEYCGNKQDSCGTDAAGNFGSAAANVSGNATAYGQNGSSSGSASTAAPNPNYAPDPEGFLSIVKLVVLGIVTFGIYIYIWIYRTNEFISKRTPLALQSGSGVQVVLCLFVPFYVLYWLYKQCKAIDDFKARATGRGGDDLSIICLILSIFGFGIVAYALMQDQINKVVKPAPTAYDFYSQAAPAQETAQTAAAADAPAQTVNEAPVETAPVYEAENTAPAVETVPAAVPEAPADIAAMTDAQIETVKKLKALLDADILTEEEFEAKKKQVLGL